MQTYQPSLFARHDTLFGVCEAIGEDFGFNPIYLRVALAVVIFFNIEAALIIYLAAGVLVLASRLIYRAPRKLAPQQVMAEPAPVAEVAAAPVQEHEEILMAAAA